MAVWSEISLSKLKYSRVDADFYHPKYLEFEKDIYSSQEHYDIVKLQEVINVPVRTGRTPSKRTIKPGDETVHFIKTDTLREGRIVFDACDYLPIRVIAANDFIEPDSVLVTIIGATPEIVGRTAIIQNTDPVSVTNQNVAVISTGSKLNPYYLTAYLLTEYGRNQLWQHSRQTGQVNLNCREVERILIVLPDPEIQNTIGNNIKQSHFLLEKSKSLYSQAQQMLETELGLDQLVFEKPVGYAASFSEIMSSHRIDADYFQPKYRDIQEVIFNYRHGWGFLLDIADSQKPNIDPSQNPHHCFDYIELSGIDSNLGMIVESKQLLGENAPSRARRLVRKGDIIASAVVGSIDKAALVDRSYDGSLASTGFFHFVPKTITSEYLLILIRSIGLTMQLQQEATGGILSAVPDSHLKNIVVPKIPEQVVNEITSLVNLSHQARRESEELIEIAKGQVQDLITQAVER